MESDTRSGRGDVAAAVDCGGNGARLGRRRVGSDRRRARPIDICEGRSLAAAEASVLRRATFSAMRGEQQPGLACQLRTIYSECVVCREKKNVTGGGPAQDGRPSSCAAPSCSRQVQIVHRRRRRRRPRGGAYRAGFTPLGRRRLPLVVASCGIIFTPFDGSGLLIIIASP